MIYDLHGKWHKEISMLTVVEQIFHFMAMKPSAAVLNKEC